MTVNQCSCVQPVAALCPGDTIAIVSPAAPSASAAFEQGLAYLSSLGYVPKLMPHATQERYYLAGDDAGKVADIHQAVADPTVKAILSARGGYGCLRILPQLDWGLIQAHPKIWVGFSDLTSLLLPLVERTGLTAFHGPMLTSNLIENDPFSQNQLWSMLTGELIYPYTLPNQATYQCIRPGMAEGPLKGGNITLLAALCGTPYQPDLRGAVLFVEDWHEQFYSLDRQWQQLKLAGLLEGVAGILFADFIEIGDAERWPDYDLKALFTDLTQDLQIPVGYGFSIGHGLQNVTVPLGGWARFEATNGHLEIVSSPVIVAD